MAEILKFIYRSIKLKTSSILKTKFNLLKSRQKKKTLQAGQGKITRDGIYKGAKVRTTADLSENKQNKKLIQQSVHNGNIFPVN